MKHKTSVQVLNLQQSIEQAMALQQQGNLRRAARIYKAILKQLPDQFEALHFLGVLRAQQNKFKDAAKLFAAATKSDPSSFEAHNNLGNAYQKLGRHDDAIACHRKAIELDPKFATAHYNLGLAHMALEQFDEAAANYATCLEIRPDIPQVLNNLGSALRALRRVDEAIDCYQKAIDLKPDFAEAHNNLGNALRMLNRDGDAVEAYRKAIGLEPDSAELHINLGGAMFGSNEVAQAEASYRTALELEPENTRAVGGLGHALIYLNRHDEAIALLRAADHKGQLDGEGIAQLTRAQKEACDWHGLEVLEERVRENVRRGVPGASPVAFLSMSESPADQLRCGRQFAERKIATPPEPLWTGERYDHDRLKIAYLSADFHNHATSQLMIEQFECHDQSRFETFAFSFGVDDQSDLRKRLENAFDHFIDVRELTSLQAAQKLRDLEIDIAIDLSGYSAFTRLDILSHRPAPVQAEYLVYPGTLGVDFIDYVFVDRTVVPTEHRQFFSEQPVYLPGCYMVSDAKRPVAQKTPSRKALGLPEDGFVFCCFNNSYKFTPRFFDIWARVLKNVPGSALWLLGGNRLVDSNLREAALARGLDGERLVLAPRVPVPEHMARMRQADLFLDCLPYGAHTTANEALWMGLPVLTIMGKTFAGRVAASHLQTIGLPELITDSEKDYEELAVRLATEPDLLSELKERLALKRQSSPLFDAELFTRQVEAAYGEMRRRSACGEARAALSVEADGTVKSL
jgi:predicted O-linked N-acetylglucosamine transferase (SPINDLY family)